MRELDLKMFDDPVTEPETYTVTVKYDSRFIDDVTTDYETYTENQTVNIDVDYKDGFALQHAIVFDDDNYSLKTGLNGIKMGTSNMTVVLVATTSGENEYFVREPVMIDINGKRTRINPTQRLSVNNGTLSTGQGRKVNIPWSDSVSDLIDQGILLRAKHSSFSVDIGEVISK